MKVWDWIYSVIETPIFRAVPSITFIADSILVQFKSGSFVLAISSNWDLLILPTAPLEDSPAPFSIPAAFTKTTGKLHWHCLVKTRAIESGSYVFAAAQCGVHENGRETFGLSMIVNPWGEVLAEADENSVCYIASKIDTNIVNEVRKRIPSTLKFN